MKAFDEDLKLKLTMNIDAIQQDLDVWALEQEKHIQNIFGSTKNKELIKDDELIPDYVKNNDETQANSIEQMQKIL